MLFRAHVLPLNNICILSPNQLISSRLRVVVILKCIPSVLKRFDDIF